MESGIQGVEEFGQLGQREHQPSAENWPWNDETGTAAQFRIMEQKSLKWNWRIKGSCE
jgi:hypothetical protein